MSGKKHNDEIFNFKFFLKLSLVIIFSAGIIFSQKTNVTADIRIMSYNIRVAVDQGINSWDERKQKVASMIRFHHADIVGLQEALKMQIDDLLKLLPEYNFEGVGRDDGKEKGEYCAVLYNRDKFRLIGHSTFWLSETPDVVSTGWDAALPRIVTWVWLKDNRSDKDFYLFNTHFDHVGIEARKNSAKLILDKVREIAAEGDSPSGQPVIITGDFNSRPESEVYKIMTEEFSDAMSVSKYGHYGSHVSFNAFGKQIEEGNRIDFIFVNDKVIAEQHGIIGETFEGNYPSDHMPVLAQIVLK